MVAESVSRRGSLVYSFLLSVCVILLVPDSIKKKNFASSPESLLIWFAVIIGIIVSNNIIVGFTSAHSCTWIRDVSPVLHQREGGQGLHHQGCMSLC